MTAPRTADGPARDCQLCPRLVQFRETNRTEEPHWHNAPVPSFGDLDARLLIVGLAPGRTGANRTGRPFTGDYAGDLLYATLLEFGLATGTYGASADDTVVLSDCRITNAVRCVPPENKPTPLEIKSCAVFLRAETSKMPRLRAVVALGRIAHDAVLRNFDLKIAAHPFAHGQRHRISEQVTLFDSFHCSRYNTNTGKLTTTMFQQVFAAVRDHFSLSAA
ncbi:MAG TPA: uracil-DNA glycosylase [Alphaproteobacteria bacterium]|nr:uracil-DNA glycosylase [Alphaproteobacteria bacterium]HAJ47446.1 uracil-DNA glycosylase [Alphaproteobacteria bacterium]